LELGEISNQKILTFPLKYHSTNRNFRRMKLSSALLAIVASLSYAKKDGQALSPPMGWMSWQRYVCETDCETYPDSCISENLYMKATDLLVSEGYLDAGYSQVSIDDCWSTQERDDNGDQQANPDRFPSGLKALGDYMHNAGVKFGFYSDIGTHTCGGYLGMKGNFQRDIDKFVSWGIDYLKLDGCYEDIAEMHDDYTEVSKILDASGRDIVFSCSWPAYVNNHGEDNDGEILQTLSEICHTWRNFDDVADSWNSVSSIIDYWARNTTDIPFVQVSGPGSWNDADMLMVGNNGLSLSEERTQFALYAIFASPLFLSTDLTKVSPESKAILQNREIISVNQDQSQQGIVLSDISNDPDWWVNVRTFGRALSDGTYAVVLQNYGNMGPYVNIKFDVSLLSQIGASVTTESQYTMRNLYTGKDVEGTFTGDEFVVPVESSSVEMFIVTLA